MSPGPDHEVSRASVPCGEGVQRLPRQPSPGGSVLPCQGLYTDPEQNKSAEHVSGNYDGSGTQDHSLPSTGHPDDRKQP